MTTAYIVITGLGTLLLAIIVLLGKIILIQMEKNADLQTENTNLLERNLKLERQLKKMQITIDKNDKDFKELNHLCDVSNKAIIKYQTKGK